MLSLPTLTATDFLPLWPALILSAGACLVLLSEVFLSSALAELPGAADGRDDRAGRRGGGGERLLDAGGGVQGLRRPGPVREPGVAAGLHRGGALGAARAGVPPRAAGRARRVLRAPALRRRGDEPAGPLQRAHLPVHQPRGPQRRHLRAGGVPPPGPRPAEAGFKYFILGAFSSAVLLYGTSLLFGATRSTLLPAMGAELARVFSDPLLADRRPLAYCGLALIGAGFGFKIAAVPFHMWTPDVYEGAPTPVTAMMSAAVKAAAFAAMVRGVPGAGAWHPRRRAAQRLLDAGVPDDDRRESARAPAAEREADAGLLLHLPRRLRPDRGGLALRAKRDDEDRRARGDRARGRVRRRTPRRR
jgi:NADH-quinone oxidoreductase subunit N